LGSKGEGEGSRLEEGVENFIFTPGVEFEIFSTPPGDL